jgi:predicted SnoaL-like aldol condensation-catalyzing enzyme
MHRPTRTLLVALAAASAVLYVGPAVAFAQGYLSALESNKKVVFDFYRLVVEPRNPDLLELYLAPDFFDHDGDQKGAEAVAKWLKSLPAAASDDISETLRNPPAFIMANGDLVTWMFKQSVPDPKDKSKMVERYSLDVFRIKDRKIAEHWKGLANLP